MPLLIFGCQNRLCKFIIFEHVASEFWVATFRVLKIETWNYKYGLSIINDCINKELTWWNLAKGSKRQRRKMGAKLGTTVQ